MVSRRLFQHTTVEADDLQMYKLPAMFCGFLMVLPGALAAKKAGVKAGPEIVAHLPAEAIEASQMSLRTEQGWDFLYIQTSTDGATTVLNVSRPGKPVVVRKTSTPQTVLKPLGGSLAFAEDAPAKTAAPSSTPHRMRCMDVSDPANPHSIPELDGVTSYAVDRVRGLLYLSNASGLWIVHEDGLVDHSVKMWEDFVKAQ